jgi:hypothetical protein
MQHVTSIIEDPVTKSLWVAGFSFNYIPDRQEILENYQFAAPFYRPYLAKVPVEPNDVNVTAVNIWGAGGSDLAMPLSICWTGARPTQEKCGGADLSGNGNVNMLDFAKLAIYWLNTNCASLNNCNGADLEPEAIPDGDVDLRDLDVFAVHWLNTGCL